MAQQFRFPAEWEKHSAVVMAWPWDESLWQENLLPAQAEFKTLVREIQSGPHAEKVIVLVPDQAHQMQVDALFKGLKVETMICPVGDIWLRDTAPLFYLNSAASGEKRELKAKVLRFNGWGEKYLLEGDLELGQRIALGLEASPKLVPGLTNVKYTIEHSDWLGEGGALEFDGEGTVLTSRQCLLNPNRKGPRSEAEVEARLKRELGVEKVLWVTEGLLNDHTDGHIDTIARYVGPAEVAIHSPVEGDPNRAILEKIRSELEGQTDALGRKLKIHLVPSAGEVLDEDGEVMPASHLNFYIGNATVVVPTYGTPSGEEAVKAIQKIYPNHRVVGAPSLAILSGGGSFHCITQQIPLLES